jgi:hypothetical protein
LSAQIKGGLAHLFEKNEPDLRELLNPATLLRGVGIELPDMLIEIEAWGVVPRNK